MLWGRPDLLPAFLEERVTGGLLSLASQLAEGGLMMSWLQ